MLAPDPGTHAFDSLGEYNGGIAEMQAGSIFIADFGR